MQTFTRGGKGRNLACAASQEGFCNIHHTQPIWPDGLFGGNGRQIARHIFREYPGLWPLREER